MVLIAGTCVSHGNAAEDAVSHDAKALPKTVTTALGMKMSLIPAGEFLMGAAASDGYAQEDEKPRHPVRITRPFYLGTYEVTKGEFSQFVMQASYRTDAERDGKGGAGWNDELDRFIRRDPKYSWRFTGWDSYEDDHPVVNVSWNDATAFCEWLSRKESATCRLPTEAEWEYACRAGTDGRFQNGDDQEALPQVANVADGTARRIFPEWTTIQAKDGYVFSAPVGKFQPNRFGLYDTLGNVWEWCADFDDADYYRNAPIDDPRGPAKGRERINRGGCWDNKPEHCRTTDRNRNPPTFRYFYLGFRVARETPGD
jgi:formylglycine-generating enzyme